MLPWLSRGEATAVRSRSATNGTFSATLLNGTSISGTINTTTFTETGTFSHTEGGTTASGTCSATRVLPLPGAVSIFEGFQDYPIQSDTTGVVDPEEGFTVFRITTTGATGATDPIVATVSEALAASAGIAAEGGNKFWTLGSSAGPTGSIAGEPGHVLIGDIPSFGPLPAPSGGSLGAFFSFPRDLTGATIRAQVRETTAAAATQFRFLLADAEGREIWTAAFPLTTAFPNLHRAHHRLHHPTRSR